MTESSQVGVISHRQPSHFPQSHSSTTTTTTERREQPKSFVFIDEQNRHKRLKVVKACDGCRRRKIKCDAATTNAWPCGSCVRLKISCVPPTPEPSDSFNHDSDNHNALPFPTHTSNWEYPNATRTAYSQPATSGSYVHLATSLPQADNYDFSATSYGYDSRPANHQPVQSFQETHDYTPYQLHRTSTYPGAGVARRQDSTNSVKSDGSDQPLAEQMGSLQISFTGNAAYLNSNGLNSEQPAIVEEDIQLPQSVGTGSLVQIPPEMMPTDEQASEYFKFFFDNIHPYIPVLNPRSVYRQWDEDRYNMSPLILEAIFACSTRMLGEEEKGARWLALAKKHEESFKDTPRLSTLQGLLLLLKARETMPTRGYYYRSWTSIFNMIAMAKDLGLHEHHEQHMTEGGCDSKWSDCLAKTRVWHSLYLVELIVGGPQGRSDFGASTDTVDFDNTYPRFDQDDPELKISQQFSYFMRIVQNVRESVRILTAFKKKKRDDWAQDGNFLKLNAAYEAWIMDLPPHLQIPFPLDGSVPQIPFHYVANLQLYWNLSMIMHHRPQLQLITDTSSDEWKKMWNICYSAAKRSCLLQEAILRQYGPSGMLYMQRGINFTIYMILTSTMLHLVAITHPDPEVHAGASDYFTRHMRILELCSSSWPMPEMEAQILSLRQAFSADINKPFELKAELPSSPGKSSSPQLSENGDVNGQLKFEQPLQANGYDFPQSPPTPPHTAANGFAPDVSYPTPESLAMMGFDRSHYTTPEASIPYSQAGHQWNPTSIISNFESMMGVPSSEPSMSSVSPPPNMGNESYFGQPSPSQQLDSRYAAYSQPPTSTPVYTSQSMPNMMPGITSVPTSYPQQQQQYYQQPQQNHITPSMWQSAVINAYGSGTKRRWNDDSGDMSHKRMHRT